MNSLFLDPIQVYRIEVYTIEVYGIEVYMIEQEVLVPFCLMNSLLLIPFKYM